LPKPCTAAACFAPVIDIILESVIDDFMRATVIISQQLLKGYCDHFLEL